MGTRVDEDTLRRQNRITGDEDRLQLEHKALLNGPLPTHDWWRDWAIRLAMFCFKKHIGEVQTSVWPHPSAMNMKISYKEEREWDRNGTVRIRFRRPTSAQLE